MNNVGMANMNAMAGPVGAPMPMAMNNGAMPMGAQQMSQQQTQAHRTMLNTYIYDYFVKEGMYDVARAMLSSEQHINVLQKDSPRQANGAGDDPMDTDSKDDLDSKRPSDLPAANIPISSDSCFLYEWFGLFWEMLNGHRKPNSSNNAVVGSYINHTNQQNRLKQSQQQEMLRQMRPDQMQFNPAMMRNMQNGMNPMAPNKNNLARTAMANNQNNPQAMAMMQQQAKQNQMQRDPSDMDGSRRPASPGSTDNAPSPSKRPRLEGQGPPFNPPQAGGMMPNGRPQQPGMPGQQQQGVGIGIDPSTQSKRAQAATQLLLAHNIDPTSLTADKFQNFANQAPQAQKNSIATYSQNLQQHHGQQMPNKGMGQPGNPQGQGSPMMQQGPNPAEISTLYNANDFGGMRPGPANGQGGGSNHALQDYQMQLMLLEQQNKKRLMMARQEQDSMGGNMPRVDGPAVPGAPGGPPGPNGQGFPETSPQGGRPGASPNPSEQMKRGTPQMNPTGIPSPLPADGAPSRGSPNPMNFAPGMAMDPNMASNPQFLNGMNGQMVNAQQMNGGMRPPSSHPGQPFNGQVNPQMMAARQAQAGQAGPNQMQWQGGPNGAMIPQGPQGVQGTPQQRNAQMPPPSAPAPGGPANGRTQPSSPATSNAAPPTPQQSNKSAPKKKATKDAKKAAGKKSNANTGATPAESSQEQEAPTPATPITPAQPGFTKNGQGTGAQPVPAAQTTAPPAPAPVAPQAQPDPSAGFGMDNTGGMNMEFGNLDFANPIDSNNVLQDFDFDSFLHDGDAGGDAFDFTNTFDMQGGEIATE